MAESPHTTVNLSETENLAEAYGIGDAMEARFPSRDLGLEQSGVSLQQLKPGKRQPFGHRHQTQEELYVVLSGSGRINLDGEVVELRAMDAVRIENPLDDVENLPGWWG